MDNNSQNSLNSNKSPRIYPIFSVLLIAISLSIAYYAEYVQHFMPCPLCLLQRYVFIFLGIIFIFAAIFNPKGVLHKVYGALISLVSLCGLALSIRQIYLQSLPPSSNIVCLPGMQYLFKTMSWFDALRTVLHGSQECGEVHWRMLGLSMAWWSAFLFVFLFIINIVWLNSVKNNRR